MKRILLLSTSIALMISSLTGCVGAVAVGAITATAATTNERSFSEVIDDEAITLNITADITTKDKKLLLDNNVIILTIRKKVLLVGQVGSDIERTQIANLAQHSDNVVQVYNQLRIGSPITFEQRSKDSWLTTKVKASMLELEGIKPLNLKVLTENSEVFLIGTVTHNEGDQAAEAARYVVGVNKVIKVFEYKD